MTGKGSIRLDITAGRISAWLGDEQLLSSSDAMMGPDAPFWAALAPLCSDQPHLDVHLSAPLTFDIPLDADEESGALADILAMRAPLLPAALLWTHTRSVADCRSIVSVTKRNWAEEFTALLANVGLPKPQFRAAPDGALLDQQIPAPESALARRVLAALILLSIALAALTYSTWRDRQQVEARIAALAAPAAGRVVEQQSRDQPTLTETLSRIPRKFDANARLIAIESRADGATMLQIDTADPDQLRMTIASDRALQGLREDKQAQGPDGRYRVDYSFQAVR